METNDRLYHEAIRHAVYSQRFGGGLQNKMLKLVRAAEKDIREQIIESLGKLKPADIETIKRNGSAKSKRLIALQEQFKSLGKQYQDAVEKPLSKELTDFAAYESGYNTQMLKEIVPIKANFVGVSATRLKKLALDSPIEGLAAQTFQSRIAKWGADVTSKVEDGLRTGLLIGESLSQLKTRLSKITGQKKQHLETLIRTAANHVSGAVRVEIAQKNSDVVAKVQWRSTLDKRTSDICKLRDGELYEVQKALQPPAHPNCRSVLVFITRASRSSDEFKKGKTRASMTGQVPDDISYNDWLKMQSDTTIRDVMGNRRFELYKTGKIELDDFYNSKQERRWTLDELRRREPEAFQSSVAVRAQPETSRYGATSASELEFHNRYFASADQKFVRVIEQMPETQVNRSTRGSSFYNPPSRQITMRRRNADQENVIWGHEYGHFVDDVYGSGGRVVSAEAAKVLKADRARLRAADKRNPEKGIEIKLSDNFKAALRASLGDKATSETKENFIGLISEFPAQGATSRMLHMIYKTTQDERQRQMALMLADAVSAVTNNDVGFGHTKGYYKRFSRQTTGVTGVNQGHTTEAFANYFTLFSQTDDFAKGLQSLYSQLMPETKKVFDGIIQRIQ